MDTDTLQSQPHSGTMCDKGSLGMRTSKGCTLDLLISYQSFSTLLGFHTLLGELENRRIENERMENENQILGSGRWEVPDWG